MGEIFYSQGREAESIEARDERLRREASRSATIARDVVGRTVQLAKNMAMKGVERVAPGLADVMKGVEKTARELALETGENTQVTRAVREGMDVMKTLAQDLTIERNAPATGPSVDPRTLTPEQQFIAHTLIPESRHAIAIENTLEGRQRGDEIRDEARRRLLAIDEAARVRRRGG